MKVKIGGDSDSALEIWHKALDAVLQHEPWKKAPAGLLQELHTPPGPTNNTSLHTGPITPPHSGSNTLQNASDSTSSEINNITSFARKGTPASEVPIDVDLSMLYQLQQMGYTESQVYKF